MMQTRRATIADLDQCAAVLGEAFRDYPWTRWTVAADDHVARVTALQRLALEHFGLPHGEVWVAETAGTIESVAVWMDNGTEVPRDSGVAARAAALEGDRHAASAAAEAMTAAWRPSERHMYLATVGTLPDRRGRGLARAVLTAVLDPTDLPAFLETSSEANVRLYEQLGFVVVDHLRIPDGGPDVWAMLRR